MTDQLVPYARPWQWNDLLQRDPRFEPLTPLTPIELTRDRHAELCEAHRDISESCPYKHDLALYSKVDYWAPATERGGDCEDLALARWALLLERNFPRDCLALCLAASAHGPHAVLLVFTSAGWVVLDNLMWMPAAMPDLTHDLSTHGGYRWIARSDPAGGDWVDLREGEGLRETQRICAAVRVFNSDWNSS